MRSAVGPSAVVPDVVLSSATAQVDSLLTLRERALLATGTSLTISDVREPDQPLVWANPAFTEMTGYSLAESLGRNCRFLQGPDTDPAALRELREAQQAGASATVTLLNRRRDGSTFWNELSICPVRDWSGEITHYVGVQADVTSRVEAQQARDAAVAQVAESARRHALLADVTSRMSLTQNPQHLVELLAEALVGHVGSWCAVFTVASDGPAEPSSVAAGAGGGTAGDTGRMVPPYIYHPAARHDPEIRRLVSELGQVASSQISKLGPVWRVLHGDPFVLIPDYDAASDQQSGRAADERTALLAKLGVRSVLCVPLLARGGIVGCVALLSDASRPPLDEMDLSLVRDLSVRAGLMLENTQLYAREKAAAAALQRSLLPRLPRLNGLDIAASYVPAADALAVGGDWYDVFALQQHGDTEPGESTVGIVVGDVMGHDVDSAARMGKLSTVVRSYGWPGAEPRDVLTATDALLGSGLQTLATCWYARLTLHADGGALLEYASAGHPPAILRSPDGSATLLDGAPGPMLGVAALMRAAAPRPPDARMELPPGSTLICFTDGLVDSFAAEPDFDVGMAELRRLAGSLPADAPPASVVARLTGDRRHSDDVAIVAIRIE